MRNKTLKKCIFLTMACTLIFNPLSKTIYAENVPTTLLLDTNIANTEDVSKTVSAREATPRSSMRIEMTTSIDNQQEIFGYEEIEVKVKWLESMAIKEPVRIEATNDAKILIEDIGDIIFETNGVQKDISDLKVEEGYVKFMTGTALRNSTCTITYKVRAPIAAGQFKISTKVAADDAAITRSNYIEKFINITNGLTVETTQETIYSNTMFNVFGLVNYRTQEENPDLVVSLDMYNKATGEMVYELTGADYPTDNNYEIPSLVFPDYCEDGIYVVYVTLADGWNIIGSASKEVNYVKFPLTVETSVDVVNGNTPFDIFGLINYRSVEETPDIVVSLDVFNKETEEMVYEMTGSDYPSDNTYTISSMIFPENCENGTYVIHLTIADGMNIIGSASKEIIYTK